MTTLSLPKRSIGRQSAAKQQAYDEQARKFCDYLKQIDSRQDFAVSSRGWCYILENAGSITKDEFDSAQNFINDMRKAGLLPIDFCSEDAKRRWQCVEEVDDETPKDRASSLIEDIQYTIGRYTPFSFWADKDVYIEVLVEKSDLVNVFEPVCKRYSVPIANAGGNADIFQRAEMMKRFKKHERGGRQCVLLYCGDHDPAGLRISDLLMDSLMDLSHATGWNPCNLVIERFGLNADFIKANKLTWIDNLITGSGARLDDPRHPDHCKSYVQDYLAKFGARKVEANALVVAPAEGRKLCQGAILEWLKDEESPDKFQTQLEPERAELAKEFARAIRASYEM